MVPVGSESVMANPVFDLFEASVPLCGGFAAFYYSRGSIIQQLVYQVKYRGKRKTGIWLGRRMGQYLLKVADLPPIDFLVPVPLHPSRLKRRGYNQCSLICSGISQELGVKVLANTLIRREHSNSQTHETRIGRWENVRDSFDVMGAEHIRGKTILLVDDVVTTGSTMLACAKTLIERGGCHVCIAAVAISGE